MTPYIFFARVTPILIAIAVILLVIYGCIRWYLTSNIAGQRRKINEYREYVRDLENYHVAARDYFKRFLVGDVSTTQDELYEMTQPIEKVKNSSGRKGFEAPYNF